MDDIYKAVFGAIGFAVTIIGVVMKFNHTNSGKFKDVHTRIDDVKDKFVRQDHLDAHLRPIRDEIERNRQDQKDNHREIINILNKK